MSSLQMTGARGHFDGSDMHMPLVATAVAHVERWLSYRGYNKKEWTKKLAVQQRWPFSTARRAFSNHKKPVILFT